MAELTTFDNWIGNIWVPPTEIGDLDASLQTKAVWMNTAPGIANPFPQAR